MIRILPLPRMVIAVNTRFLQQPVLEGFGNFIRECFERITRRHPEHQFIFIFDRLYDPSFIFSENIIPVVIGPPARHPLLWKWWYDVSIPYILRKYKADVFVSADGQCSLRTKVPQCLVVHDLAFLHHPDHYKRSHAVYYKKYTPRFLKKATEVITVSEWTKSDIHQRYQLPANKITVVHNGARAVFQPLPEVEKEQVKKELTDHREYFLYYGAIHPRKNLFRLLKAFSIFKKRQKSSFKLVIAGRLAWKYEPFLKSLETYRYRSDVVLTGYLPDKELTRVLGAAYALVYPSLYEGFGLPVLEAMQSGVPVITTAMSAMQEVAADAALFANTNDEKDIGDKMMQLYTNESLRDQLIGKGLQRAAEFSWDKTADSLWQSICNCKS